MKGWARRRRGRNCLLNRRRQNDPTGIILKYFRGSYRERDLLTAVSSNAVECLALQFFCSFPSDCFFFFLSFGHLFRTELRTSPFLWWNLSSEENRNGECEGSWTMASPARQHEQGIATYIYAFTYICQRALLSLHTQKLLFFHLQLKSTFICNWLAF